MHSENLAIVFVDIVGFTKRTSEQSREENEAMLSRFDVAVRPLVRGFEGRVVKTLGDAFLLTFRSPTNAVHCAMAIVDELARQHAGLPEDQRFDVRAALNVGEVRVDAGDIFGEAVNIAARIEGKTPAGEIYLSEAVYLSMTRSEVPSEEVGKETLKGIPEPVRLYRVPRVAEIGPYRVKGAGPVPEDSDDPEQSPAEEARTAAMLPFGGYSLERVRARPTLVRRHTLERLMDGARLKAPTVVEGAREGVQTSTRHLARWWETFLERFQNSSRFRWVVIGVVAVALVGTIVWLAWPKPKPKTGWQKFQEAIGID